MKRTRDEALHQWCPMVRIARRENTLPSGNGDDVLVGGCNTDALGGFRIPKSCRCIADECAMWRWAEAPRRGLVNCHKKFENAGSEAEAGPKPSTCKGWTFEPATLEDPACWIEPDHLYNQRRRGFCGLAGRPEFD